MKSGTMNVETKRRIYKTLRSARRKAVKLCDEVEAVRSTIPDDIRGTCLTKTELRVISSLFAMIAARCMEEMTRGHYRSITKEFKNEPLSKILAGFREPSNGRDDG